MMGRWGAGALMVMGAVAQVGRPTAEASLDRATLTVGDSLRVTVTVTHDSAAIVEWPDTLRTLGPFEILAIEPAMTESHDRSSRSFVMTAFELGEIAVPPVAVTVRSGDSATTVATESLLVVVASVRAETSEELREIKPPVDLPRDWRPWLFAGLAALAAAATAWWWVTRDRRRPPAIDRLAPTESRRPAHEVALEALEALAKADLVGRRRVKEHYIALSEIVRTYVYGRYGIDAMDMTTADIARRLARVESDQSAREAIGSLLAACDLVKFAKHRPDAEAGRSAIAAARDCVMQTTTWVGVDTAQPEAV